jgi:Ca2+-binding EF-hand superfamily protein
VVRIVKNLAISEKPRLTGGQFRGKEETMTNKQIKAIEEAFTFYDQQTKAAKMELDEELSIGSSHLREHVAKAWNKYAEKVGPVAVKFAEKVRTIVS